MMPNKNNQNLLSKTGRGFTMVEVVAATLILSIILSSVMLLINRYLGAVVDMRLQQRAFEVARDNMETLLSEDQVSDMSEYGESEEYPDIDWETVIEPFTEPVKSRMWVRAVCSASYTDSQGQFQKVELEHWITSLTAEQIKQILNQKDAMGEYYDLIKEGYMTDPQLATLAYLEKMGLDAEGYKMLIEDHRMLKLEYLQKHTVDFDQNKFDKYCEELDDIENEFLEGIGMDFVDYNTNFIPTYEPPKRADDPYDPDEKILDDEKYDPDVDPPIEEEYPPPDEIDCSGWNWQSIDRSMWPVIEKLTGCTPPY